MWLNNHKRPVLRKYVITLRYEPMVAFGIFLFNSIHPHGEHSVFSSSSLSIHIENKPFGHESPKSLSMHGLLYTLYIYALLTRSKGYSFKWFDIQMKGLFYFPCKIIFSNLDVRWLISCLKWVETYSLWLVFISP